VEIKFYGAFGTPSTRRLLDGVAMPVPYRSIEPGRPRAPTHWLISTQQLTLAGLLLTAALGRQSGLYCGISGVALRAERRQPRGGRVDGVGGG